MTEAEMIERLREHGYLCWHIGCSTRGVWTANFVNYDEFTAQRGRRGPVLSPWENTEISVSLQGDTLHEAIMNVVEEVCPLPHVEFDMDVMLGRKPAG